MDFEEGRISYPSKYHGRVQEYFNTHRDVIGLIEIGPSMGKGFHAGEIKFDTSNDDLPLILTQ